MRKVAIAAMMVGLFVTSAEARNAPAGCPSRWCGCWLMRVLGYADKALWAARNWAHVGKPADGPAPNVVVVWPHHVGIITGQKNGTWIVKSGNDGGAVRERPRSLRGVIAFRIVKEGETIYASSKRKAETSDGRRSERAQHARYTEKRRGGIHRSRPGREAAEIEIESSPGTQGWSGQL